MTHYECRVYRRELVCAGSLACVNEKLGGRWRRVIREPLTEQYCVCRLSEDESRADLHSRCETATKGGIPSPIYHKMLVAVLAVFDSFRKLYNMPFKNNIDVYTKCGKYIKNQLNSLFCSREIAFVYARYPTRIRKLYFPKLRL